jgi:tryptophan-rich sensory protein
MAAVQGSGRDALGLGVFGALVTGAAVSGSLATQRGIRSGWYARLDKPPFQPPSWVFPPVWTALYGLMAASAFRVWKGPPGPARTRALALWGGQLALNGAWSWLFFGQGRLRGALAEVLALGAGIGAYTAAARRVDRPAAWMMAPYLAWTGFATLLNADIARRNG